MHCAVALPHKLSELHYILASDREATSKACELVSTWRLERGMQDGNTAQMLSQLAVLSQVSADLAQCHLACLLVEKYFSNHILSCYWFLTTAVNSSRLASCLQISAVGTVNTPS